MAITMRAARINAGLTQKEAAEKLEISRNALTNYENGKSVPKVDLAKRMAKLYGFPINDIIFFNE